MESPTGKSQLSSPTVPLGNPPDQFTGNHHNGLTSADECFLDKIITMIKKDESEEAFYALDLNVVNNLMGSWKRNLPMVQPFYAVKCNTHRALLATLVAQGASFDCASRSEMKSILGLGVSPDRIIYSNPCKASSHIKYAANVGVNLTTFDSVDEVEKIRKLHPDCSLLIRIKAPDESGSMFPMNSKFGALPEEVSPLLRAAKTAGLRVAGVSFHIGSKSHNSQAYKTAIQAAKVVFREVSTLGMPPMNVLNIGGGFVPDALCFEAAAAAVKSAVAEYLPEEGLTLMAEPGRFFAETAFTLVTNIIGKRVRGEVRQYWINEGFYGSMMRDRTGLAKSCIPVTSNMMTVRRSGGGPTCYYSSTVFGPTCDPMDKVLEGHELPEMEVNDWLVFRNMGAYTSSCSTNFNGFGAADIAYVMN